MLREVCGQLQQQHGVTKEVKVKVKVECGVFSSTFAFASAFPFTGYSPVFGARELRRAIERLLQVPLSQLILSGELAKHKQWRAEAMEQRLVLVPVPDLPGEQ